MVEEARVTDFIRSESVLIDRGAIGELYETALKFVGIGIGGILYTAGKKGGVRGARLLKRQFEFTGEDLFQAALLAFNQSNWGRATLVHRNGTMRLEVEDSALASSVQNHKKKICHPLAGYIAGFVEEAWERPAKVRETECLAAGNDKCVFEIETG